ncbi:MAG: hypothetical protein AB1505_35200 [Candidatus Latescibacterota bacterium]
MYVVTRIVALLCLACLPLWAVLPAPTRPGQAAQRVLREVLSGGRGLHTQQLLQRMADRAGLPEAAMRDSLAAALAQMAGELQRDDEPLVQVIGARAAQTGLEPAAARKLVGGLVARARQALAKGQLYQVDRLLETEARQAGLRADGARAFLLALAGAPPSPERPPAAGGAPGGAQGSGGAAAHD